MSVIGIDFGNESCYIAAAKAGGIETLANDYSLRATPSCVAFVGKKRVLGVAAKNQQVTNMKNTISGFKRLLARKCNDPHVQHELSTIPYRVEPRANGDIGIKVNYLDQDHTFSVEQITAMLLTKLKETSINALQVQIKDCVIAVPIYFTNAERQALLDAAVIAGLNVLRLMNETTCVALQYGFYKQDLPEDKPRNVIFVDCGHASLQVSACAFTKGKLKMLASSWDQIGGRDFDYVMADYFARDFQEKYKIDTKSNARAYLRLLTEVEKLKKQMSANSTKLPLGIECFMNEIDVRSSMQRSDMEQMCSDLLSRVDQTLRRCLQESKLSLDEIHSVEIVGGSSRIPAIKQLIEQVFSKPASTTLNQDEAVSRGAAIQCAIMSPAVRVREFSITDIQNYPVKVVWDKDNGQPCEVEVFPAFHAAPFSRIMTIAKRDPFFMTAMYSQPIPYPDQVIGKWHVRDVRPNDKGEAQDVKIKIRINQNGIVLITSASLVEKKDPAEIEAEENQEAAAAEAQQSQTEQQPGQEPMEVQEATFDNDFDCGSEGGDDHNQAQSPSASSPKGQGWAQRVKGWFTSDASKDKKKKSTKSIDLPFEAQTHGNTADELTHYLQEENRMADNDCKEKERVDARNALEEYVYDMREKLQEEGPLVSYVANADRENICAQLNDLENWLYEEGDDCERDVYETKLATLHSKTDPIKMRQQEYEGQQAAFEELGHILQMARKYIDEYRSGSQKYDHLTETEILNVTESTDKAQKWFEDSRAKVIRTTKTADPPVKIADIRREWQTLSSCVNSVMNRPKPKPPTPPATGNQKQNAGDAAGQNGDVNNGNKQTDSDKDKMNNSTPEDSTMEVE